MKEAPQNRVALLFTTAVLLAAGGGTIEPAAADLAEDFDACEGRIGEWPDACRRAQAELETIIQAGSAEAGEREQLGMVYESLQLFDQALAQYNLAVELHETSYNHFLRGRLYYDHLKLYDEAIHDFDIILDRLPSALAFYYRGSAYRHLGNDESWLRDILSAFLLNPNLIRYDWGAPPLDYSLSTAFGRAVESIRPSPPLPPDDTFSWSPPQQGTQLTYVSVSNDEEPVDPMLGAINDIIGWFVTQDVPLPVENTVFDYAIGATDGINTSVEITDRFAPSPVEKGARSTTALSTIPIAQAFGPGPELQRSFGDQLALIGPMAVGQVVRGSGTLFVDCPSQLNPLTVMIGCLANVDQAAVGEFDWSLTFEGWEDLLVPARRAATAKLVYEETASMTILGTTRTQQQRTSWWIDPELNWWLKRESVVRQDGADAGLITTLEAMTMETPD